MLTEIEITIKNVSSFGEIDGIYKNKINIEWTEDEDLSIGAVTKDENDERGVYFILNKIQCQILADILLRASTELSE